MSETDDLDRLRPDTAEEAALDERAEPAPRRATATRPTPPSGGRGRRDRRPRRTRPMPDDANEADVAEQRREVPVDEDDYR